jgi:hypothetical protein
MMTFRWILRILMTGATVLLANNTPRAHDTNGYYDGYSLRELCQGREGADRATNLVDQVQGWRAAAECEGYTKGVWDGLVITGIFSGASLKCVPDIPEGQAEILVRRYLEAHPEKLQFPAPNIISAALSEAFRCDEAR